MQGALDELEGVDFANAESYENGTGTWSVSVAPGFDPQVLVAAVQEADERYSVTIE